MLASVLISAVSVALLSYWFRYTCLLLLQNRNVQTVPVGNQFVFAEVRERMGKEFDLEPLSRLLERDYRVLTYLLRHATQLGTQPLEERILMLDYRLMKCWYSLTRKAAPEQARRALEEMISVVACLAQKMGEQAGLQSEI